MINMTLRGSLNYNCFLQYVSYQTFNEKTKLGTLLVAMSQAPKMAKLAIQYLKKVLFRLGSECLCILALCLACNYEC